ncbi:MAG: helix-turn-helix domain-containing protein, partial [Candidatus Nanoarchaeia archaeon]
SKTCKNIIGYLAENKEASEKDLSDKLGIPLNTVEYNIKKLVESGFVQKRKNFFWSRKGKKITMYEVSNKSIIISHKKPTKEKIKSIVPAVILTAAGTLAIWAYGKVSSSLASCNSSLREGSTACVYNSASVGAPVASSALQTVSSVANTVPYQVWLWFLIGGLVSILIFSIVNWRKL